MNRYDRSRARAGVRQGAAIRPGLASTGTRSLPPLLSRNQWRHAKNLARQRTGESMPLVAILLVVAGVIYNGVLAFLNAHGFYVGRPLVVLSEIIILSGAGFYILMAGARRIDGAPPLFLAFFLLTAMAISAATGGIFVEMARNAAIIALFIMVGEQISLATLKKTFIVSAIAVAAVLAIEIASVETYASLFDPAAYFAQTRNIGVAEFNDIGLFTNALGFDERFSILKIIDHRASSIFLEQVSLGNFAVVLTIFLSCKWHDIGVSQKLILIFLIALIIITTASRTAFGLVLVTPLVHWLAPKLNRYASLLVMPVVLATALIIILTFPPTRADVLEGRLGLTINNLSQLDVPSLLGLNAHHAPRFADSGYVYVILGSSIFGMLVLWLFVSLVAAGRSAESRRCSLLLSLYVFSNLTISGTSAFSIKTAALLWLLVGYVRERERKLAQAAEPAKELSDAAPGSPRRFPFASRRYGRPRRHPAA